jgi:hypothetical protein
MSSLLYECSKVLIFSYCHLLSIAYRAVRGWLRYVFITALSRLYRHFCVIFVSNTRVLASSVLINLMLSPF